MKVRILNRTGKLPLEASRLAAALDVFAEESGRLAARRGEAAIEETTVVFHGDKASAAAHKAVMGVEGPTDVITLRYEETPASPAHGELLVNPHEAVRQVSNRLSGNYRSTLLPEEASIPWSVADELLLYVAHGFDHLAGSDDLTAAGFRAMRRRELRWLAKAGSAVNLKNAVDTNRLSHTEARRHRD